MSQLVDDGVRHYHELLERHVPSVREMVEKGYGRELRPHFVAAEDFDRIMDVTTLLNRAVVVAADRLALDPALRKKVGIPDYLDKVIEIDRESGVPSIMARFDGLVDREGVFKVIEYNANPGFLENLIFGFAEHPIAGEFAARFKFRTTTLSDRIMKELTVDEDGERPPVIAVPVTSLPTPRDKYHRMQWTERAEAHGWRIIDATLDQFRFRDGRLFLERDDIVAVDVLMPEWNDLIGWVESSASNPVLEAMRAKAVRVLNGVSRGLLCGYKHTFELLSNPEYASLFEPAVAAVLAKHVPWTRALRNAKTTYGSQTVDLLPFVAEQPERWVLKPSGGHKGSGVVIGSTCTNASWVQTLKRALTQKYIVQERVLGAPEQFPYAAKEGAGFVLEETTPSLETFVWAGSRAGDALARTSSSGNHTVGAGGSFAGLWILEGAKE